MKVFAADRAAFTAGMRRMTLVDAAPQLATYFGRFERQLADGAPFLFGDAAVDCRLLARAQRVVHLAAAGAWPMCSRRT